VDVRWHEPLDTLNTLGLSGYAQAYARPTSVGAAGELIRWASAEGLKVLPWGEGSNIVLCGDVDALVMTPANQGRVILERSGQRVLIEVAAGENWHELVQWSLAHGFYGLENLALIPGSVGAAPVQNIGAYGVELSRFLVAINVLDCKTGEPAQLPAADCELSYRDSIFKHQEQDRLLITSVVLELSTVAAVNIGYPALADALGELELKAMTPQEVFKAVVRLRQSKLPDPVKTPNVGSFFKNPVVDRGKASSLVEKVSTLPIYPVNDYKTKLPAAFLIEHCGFKGRALGQVAVHDKHALVMVNRGAKDGEQFLALARKIRQAVAKKFGVALEIEPRVLGDGHG